MRLVPMKKEHLSKLLDESHNSHLKLVMPERQCEYLESTGLNYTVMTDEGRVLTVGGVALYWKDRGEAWALFTKCCTKEFVGICRLARKVMDEAPVRRIEAAVEIGFKAGHRWMELLGFTMEAPLLKSYFANGSDVTLYARIK